MIRTSSVNGSPEMRDSNLATAIEFLTMDTVETGEKRHYTIEFDAWVDPDDCGARQVEYVSQASWKIEDGEPRWKKLLRSLFDL